MYKYLSFGFLKSNALVTVKIFILWASSLGMKKQEE
jgi:hypothetical protein